MKINEYAAAKLKELRIKKNLTQEELADELGITQQQIARYENNQRQFKQDFLFKLAEYFKVSINEFFPPIKSYAKDAINDTLGYKYISETQLAMITKLPTKEIKDIIKGNNILPKPSTLIKIGNALDDDQDENLAFDLLVSAGYVEDPRDPENELYNTEIRYLLNDKERISLCNYLCTLWNTQQTKHIYSTKEIYDTIFENDKEFFSIDEVRNLFVHYKYDNIYFSNLLKHLEKHIKENKISVNRDIINISDLEEKDKEQIKHMIDLMRKDKNNKNGK